MDLAEWPPKGAQRHPWEKARFEFFAGVIEHAGLSRDPVSVLDVGAGDGWFARALSGRLHPRTAITCWDHEYTMQDVERFSSITEANISYVADRPKERFDLLLLLDVLEHVEQDEAFLSSVVEAHMGAGSWMLVSLPAWGSLYSRHDEHLRHFRRYDPGQGRALLTRQGLTIVMGGGLFHSLVLFRIAAIILASLGMRQDRVRDAGDWRYGKRLTAVVEKALNWDNRISAAFAKREWDLPGLSWWALCKKQPS
jgi:hypothetical protein